jgi:two-component system, chemotaxis family, chemotaxis protein CheY
MNILVTDDSKMIRHMVITALNELGYDSITEAQDVGVAKNLLKGKKFDLIISDWHMPGESGLDFLKYVKSCPEYASLPFILQTTESDKKNIVEAVKSGVQGYLIKPVQKNALAQKMLELSTVYKFQPPSMAVLLKEGAEKKPGPEATAKSGPGISAGSLHDFASALAKQEFGFSCEVKTGCTTPLLVCIGNDAYRQFSKALHDRYPGGSCVVVCDSQTESKHKDVFDTIVSESGGFKIVVPDIIKNRTIMQYGSIIEALSAKKTNSSSVIMAFGDMPLLSVAGFAAATYRGGMRFIVVPLSLADFLDTSVGGTWIINGDKGESVAGLRYDPMMTWFDGSSLAGVPDPEYTYTCAEFFRYAFIGGKEFLDTMMEKWDLLLKKDLATIAECTRLCIAARASICVQDIDNATRVAALRFAQSLAGALVDCSRKTALHPGQALFRAIACMCEVAKQSGTLAPQSVPDYIKLLQKMPAFQMPEVLNHNQVFQKAFGPESHDFGQSTVALPFVAGSVITGKEVPDAVYGEALKGLLSVSQEPAEKKK